MSKRKPAGAAEARRALPRSAGGRAGQAGAAAAAHRLRPHQHHRVRHSRAARRGSARGRRHRGRAAADGRGSGLGKDPHPHLSHRPSGGRARRRGENRLAITFTRRAAAEMRERLSRLLPTSTGKVAIHTFHSLGLAILREHASAAGLITAFASRARPSASNSSLRRWSECAQGRTPAARDLPGEAHAELGGRRRTEARAAYARAMALRNWIDFDDLVALSVRALVSDARITELYRSRRRWIRSTNSRMSTSSNTGC